MTSEDRNFSMRFVSKIKTRFISLSFTLAISERLLLVPTTLLMSTKITSPPDILRTFSTVAAARLTNVEGLRGLEVEIAVPFTDSIH